MDNTTKKGFGILEILARSEDTRGISELSRETGLTRSNVQRILATLCDLGYADRDPLTNRYFASLRLWEMGIFVLSRNPIVRAARAQLLAVRSSIGETVVLCVRDGDEIIYVNKLESQSPIRMSCAIGTRLPMNATATGRVIAAFLPSDEQRTLFRRLGDDFGTTGTADVLAAVRRRGYEISFGSYRIGVNSLAVPIWNSSGSVEASIAITGPEERLTENMMMGHLHELLDAASRISESLGYSGELV